MYISSDDIILIVRKDVLEQKFRKVLEDIGMTKKIVYKVKCFKSPFHSSDSFGLL